MADRLWPNRLRWRTRGAWRRVACPAGVIAAALLLCRMPVAGTGGPHPVTALLLAVGIQLVVIAALTHPLAWVLRRRNRAVPRIVAQDRAASALAVVAVVAVAAVGAVHRPVAASARATLALQREAAQAFVRAHAPAGVRANVDRLDTWQLGPDTFRSCVPAPDRRFAYCVYVLTDADPPRVRADRDRHLNAELAGPGRAIW